MELISQADLSTLSTDLSSKISKGVDTVDTLWIGLSTPVTLAVSTLQPTVDTVDTVDTLPSENEILTPLAVI